MYDGGLISFFVHACNSIVPPFAVCEYRTNGYKKKERRKSPPLFLVLVQLFMHACMNGLLVRDAASYDNTPLSKVEVA